VLYAGAPIPLPVNKRTLQIAKALCIAVLGIITAYAFMRLYVMGQRADISILILNVVAFAGVAGVLIYISKKERDTEEEEMFRD
jgi:ABC-type maltose transport system permease subunit